jgi:transposase-like protein
MRKSGSSIADVARYFGVTAAAVSRGLLRRGLCQDLSKFPRSKKFDRDAAFCMFVDGRSISEIARELGVSPPSIRKALVIAGLL